MRFCVCVSAQPEMLEGAEIFPYSADLEPIYLHDKRTANAGHFAGLSGTCESSGNSHFSDNHRRNLRTVYGNIGVEETQSVDRAEIDEPVMVFGNASADETSLWDVVGVIVGMVQDRKSTRLNSSH